MLSARDQFFSTTAPSTAAMGLGLEVVSESQPPVYNTTTMPLLTSNGHLDYKNGGRTPANSPVETQAPTLKSEMAKDNGRFSNLPTREPIDMEFKNLSLTVNLGFRRGNKEILHNVSGKFPGSQLIAIMGPSGAGKSTLLDALSGFKTTGVNGSLLVNGRRRDLGRSSKNLTNGYLKK
ncbi:ATP-binding cassette sub-family G member 1 [Lucilia cuprina]|nr:ATP-binding cassette sub-family G member 1 [Lucilia cuprina]